MEFRECFRFRFCLLDIVPPLLLSIIAPVASALSDNCRYPVAAMMRREIRGTSSVLARRMHTTTITRIFVVRGIACDSVGFANL